MTNRSYLTTGRVSCRPFKYETTTLVLEQNLEQNNMENMGLVAKKKLSSGRLTKRFSNQSPQLQRLARKLEFHL